MKTTTQLQNTGKCGRALLPWKLLTHRNIRPTNMSLLLGSKRPCKLAGSQAFEEPKSRCPNLKRLNFQKPSGSNSSNSSNSSQSTRVSLHVGTVPRLVCPTLWPAFCFFLFLRSSRFLAFFSLGGCHPLNYTSTLFSTTLTSHGLQKGPRQVRPFGRFLRTVIRMV